MKEKLYFIKELVLEIQNCFFSILIMFSRIEKHTVFSKVYNSIHNSALKAQEYEI